MVNWWLNASGCSGESINADAFLTKQLQAVISHSGYSSEGLIVEKQSDGHL